MDALRASYGGASSDSDSSPTISPVSSPPPSTSNYNPHQTSTSLPPPPLALLHSPDSFGAFDYLQTEQPTRVRSFPHVQGNYALHVYIPVHIPSSPRKELVQFLRKVTDLVPGLHAVDIDVPLTSLLKDDNKFEQVVLGREFHISLGRTVPIRVHQRDSVLTMLRQKLQFQKMYWIDFAKWVVFVNDDFTRSFLSMEVIAGGLAEITKQIDAVNEVYRLHNLPEFYKDPRPHISVAWASGDVGDFMTGVVEEEMKRFSLTGGSSRKHIFTCKFGGVKCRIGNRTYEICKFQEL
ncbi:uncharacterized protein [Coffea arabica]|uniref:U6 snRNA phosphodiesterase n=1 Tax=Coffea arabica TaxID=13443 RepID=A0A6P6VXT3_COFAR|nr:U6 snRNA phosphodiesterase-like isoform X4 [Coffea arabica]